ncbi:MAG: alpha-glucan family phosphorylase [Thermodesulfobacteriota bacterium]
MSHDQFIAYFSMEIALEPDIPTYSGGLGVLAGDTIRSAADLKVPMVAVSLLHRKGYFYQHLDAKGNQTEEPVAWAINDFLTEMEPRAQVIIEGREVLLRAWKYEVKGVSGAVVPVYLVDTDLPENSDWDRRLTDHLYGGDEWYRLCQEIVLGMGGVRLLRALGYRQINRFHMNEGHAAFLTLELLNEAAEKNGKDTIGQEEIEAVREKCIFTTHTPVPAGHDQFPLELVAKMADNLKYVLDNQDMFAVDVQKHIFQYGGDFARVPDLAPRGIRLNMTYLALNLSNYVNGVAKKHGEVSRLMFADYPIDAITNGVHAATWTSEPMQALFDRHIPGWREDNFSLRYVLNIPEKELWDTHQQAKEELLSYVNHQTNAGMDKDVLTLGFARRVATYKRADLLFSDIERLRRLAREIGPIQLIYAGKAHPRDTLGKDLIRRIFQAAQALKPDIKVAYLANYDAWLGRLLTGGVDVWLNTPQPPNEASGTSGMKAAMNGVPSFSSLDGWWLEGCIENFTGWSIGSPVVHGAEIHDCAEDADCLYTKLEKVIVPMYYQNREGFLEAMYGAIAINGSFFNTQRMVQQYVVKAYL